MERPDREHIAPVTYLPGVQPPSGRSDPSREPSRAEPSRAEPSRAEPSRADHGRPVTSRPTFAAMYDVDRDQSASDSSAPAPEPDALDPDASEPDAPDVDAERARAENVSMHALTRRGQSRRELERTLRSRDLSDEVISYEVERLERVGLIDDVALAQNLVGVLQERKGFGRSAIAAELARRMLAPASIEYALELIDTGDELARAREIAIKRAGQLSSYDRETAQRRLSAYLARRGYTGSTVRAAVDHALAGRQSVAGVRFR